MRDQSEIEDIKEQIMHKKGASQNLFLFQQVKAGSARAGES